MSSIPSQRSLENSALAFRNISDPSKKIQPDPRHTGLKDGQKVMMIGTAEDEAAAFQSKDVGVRGVVRGGDAQPAKGRCPFFRFGADQNIMCIINHNNNN